MRVLVTGSRTWTDKAAVHRELDEILSDTEGRMVVVHGDCSTGADRIARDWCETIGVLHEPHPVGPDGWKRHGPAAGPIRNRQMVNEGADLCLAFLSSCNRARCRGLAPHPSHGTSQCLRMARDAGIETKVVQR